MTMGAELQLCSKSCPQVVVGSISTTAWLLWLKKQPQVEQHALQFQAQNTVNKRRTEAMKEQGWGLRLGEAGPQDPSHHRGRA